MAARRQNIATATLEERLHALMARHLGMNADQLVGHVSRLDDLAGEPDIPAVRARTWLGYPHTRGPRLGRAFRLDPYTFQTLMDDARRVGRGARLDVVVPENTPQPLIGAIRRRLAPLGKRGVDVRVRPERRRRSYAFLFAL